MRTMRQKAVFILVILTLSVVKSLAQSGTCGQNLTWTFNSSSETLTISGTGEMADYSSFAFFGTPPPWSSFASSIKTVVINNGVTNIGKAAFAWTFITSITIPNNVTSIGDDAFYNCRSLTSITIPANVKKIGNAAFFYCIGLASITVASGNTAYSSESGVLFNRAKTELICFPGGKSGSYTIPGSVTSIGDDAFSACQGLTSITMPNSVTSIGGYAFSGCSGLASVTISESVTSIGMFVFDGCTRLTSITVPNSVTRIDRTAFSGCTNLTSIDAGVSNTVYSSEQGVLYNKAKTELITCPEGKSGSYTILGSVTGIGRRAFYSCSKLTSITIPGSVTSIGDYAFGYCDGLTVVTVKWTTPLSISSDVFNNTTLSDIRLIVPLGTKALYEAAPVWKEFRIEESGTGIDDIQTATLVRLEQSGGELYISHPSAAIDQVDIFDMNGRCVYRKTGFAPSSISTSSWAKGVYLVVVRTGNNKTTHKLIKN